MTTQVDQNREDGGRISKTAIGSKPSNTKSITEATIRGWLPIAISDLKTFKQEVTEQSVKSSLYHRVIRELYDENNFLYHEDEYPRVGCFIKGYVRDVWAYLEDAYELIHNHDWVSDLAKENPDDK